MELPEFFKLMDSYEIRKIARFMKSLGLKMIFVHETGYTILGEEDFKKYEKELKPVFEQIIKKSFKIGKEEKAVKVKKADMNYLG